MKRIIQKSWKPFMLIIAIGMGGCFILSKSKSWRPNLPQRLQGLPDKPDHETIREHFLISKRYVEVDTKTLPSADYKNYTSGNKTNVSASGDERSHDQVRTVLRLNAERHKKDNKTVVLPRDQHSHDQGRTLLSADRHKKGNKTSNKTVVLQGRKLPLGAHHTNWNTVSPRDEHSHSQRGKLSIFFSPNPCVMHLFHSISSEANRCVRNFSCTFTNTPRNYRTSDALLVIECKTVPKYYKPAHRGQILVHYNHEAETLTCNQPNETVSDIRISHRVSSTYRSMSSIITYPYLCWPSVKDNLLHVLKFARLPSINRNGIAAFISNCVTTVWRTEYMKELMKYIHIDVYGKENCVANMESLHTDHKLEEIELSLKMSIIKRKQYKFLIAFENSIYPEYVTEKIWHAYLTQTIPIYYGTSDVYDQAPGNNTFIDARKFAGPQQLAEYIKKVNRDASLYQSYFNFNSCHIIILMLEQD
ncbi:uncharacterized protein [Dysidea avara]|uniref:uncharacterized protein isoform X1 n=1 Tax=Dysidea avara TaxID=196820 RepID=UPI00332DBCAD